ncbi:hypothetical protein Q4Q39_04680 [Flavivirga amylovorans]|uniref:Protein BatD n=1 Tax=Flavivirga amylovorans TaxID=870486 RepID=A0ABT8WYJ4_9FLAO|nr:hypothetical protein [Flavivirga amylovorans]MDO5986697.1 hypothetical protein [Flavivirga amylovorans]
MMHKHTYILVSVLMFIASFLLIAQSEIKDPFKLLTHETEFEAGQNILLKFSGYSETNPLLYCSNSYGSVVIQGTNKNTILTFEMPKSIANKTGFVNWKLLTKGTNLSGKFYITPKQEVITMETYLGPPSIEAGGTDYAMLVVIPTDPLDNPLQDSTQVNIKHQFLTSEYNNVLYTNYLIAYKNLYSETKSGRMLISSEALGTHSKEYTLNVLPAIPTNFEISYQQHHNYADGNQITTFTTSVIRDKYDNIVSDGTYVDVFITNKDNNILKTSGTTINGIATAKMIHPDHEDAWTVKAFIEGMAESAPLALNFKQVITDFEVVFSDNSRTITVGPLQSFMKQMIPDGLQVKLHFYQNDTKIKTLSKSSFEGYVTFKLNEAIIPVPNAINDTFKIIIETARIEKSFENIKL